MNDEITQEELSPEEAKASLGLSTRLSEQFLMSQAEQMAMEQGMTEETQPEATSEAPQAPTSEVEPKDKEMPMEEKKGENEGEMDEEMNSMRTDIELLKKLVIKEDGTE